MNYEQACDAASAELPPGDPHARLPRGQVLLRLRCARRGHLLGAVFATTHGLVYVPSIISRLEQPTVLLDHPGTPRCDHQCGVVGCDDECGAVDPPHLHRMCRCGHRTIVVDDCRDAIERGRRELRV